MELSEETYPLCLIDLGGGLYCCGDSRVSDDKHLEWCPMYRKPSDNRS